MRVAGVDVGAERKGFHLAILDGHSARCFHCETPEEVRDRCAGVAVIAVDAPCGWACPSVSPTGRSRQAERDLKARRGIPSFYTPTRARAAANGKNHYDWMFNGEKLWRAFRAHLRSRPMRLIETFPHGIACALRGQILSANNKRRDRSRLLRQLGYSLDTPASIDSLDATLCAHAAACFARGEFEAFGNATEGCIVLPPWSALPE
jgi:predicted nuclease with RNAse H fold